MASVIVVLALEDGGDVVAVYDAAVVSLEDIEERYDPSYYQISECDVEMS